MQLLRPEWRCSREGVELVTVRCCSKEGVDLVSVRVVAPVATSASGWKDAFLNEAGQSGRSYRHVKPVQLWGYISLLEGVLSGAKGVAI